MNLFINTFLTPGHLGGGYNRGKLPGPDDKISVFKFMLNSLASMGCFDGLVHIYCRLDRDYLDRASELERYIYRYFPKANLFWERNESMKQWRMAIEPFVASDADNVTFFSTNHDHIFIGTQRQVEAIKNEMYKETETRCRQLYPSHWGELTSWCYFHTYKSYDHFHSFLQPSRDGIQFLNKEAMHRWFFENDYSHSFGRTDGLPDATNEPFEILVPLAECMRHYDGYNSVGICPAMTVPPHFFSSGYKTLKYGYPAFDPDSVNVNSLGASRDIISDNGVDFTNCLEDIPYIFTFNNYQVVTSRDSIEYPTKYRNGRIDTIKRILTYNLNKLNTEHHINKPIEDSFIERLSQYAVTL